MNRSRTLILLGIVLLLGAVAVLVLLPGGGGGPAPTPTPTPVPEIPTTEIIVAAQSIPRGSIIGKDAVYPAKWPNNNLPPSDLIVTQPEQVIGKRARIDIFRGLPVLQSMVTSDPQDLAKTGYDASLFIPPGKVAVAFPIDQLSSVGYAVGPGDRVDVLVAAHILDVNQDGQYPTVPFNRDLVEELIAAGMPADAAVQQVLADTKGAKVEPRLVSQLTLQNVEVLHAGEWPASGLLPQPTATPNPAQPAQQAPSVPGGTPSPTPPRPTMFILLVDHQQALILQCLRESGVIISLALRGAGDSAPVSTESVTYQYILTTFNVTVPPKVNTIIQTQQKLPGAP